jgi:ATP-dependent Clp protease ATP-binding subunit ClpX
LTQPKNALIKQYKIIPLDDVEFTINDEALDFIVDKGLEYKLGSIRVFMRGSLD